MGDCGESLSRWLRCTAQCAVTLCPTTAVVALFVLGFTSERFGSSPGESGDGAPQGGPVKFESKVDVVILPVLVVDSRGRAIGDLKQGDFQVFDRDKRQTTAHFTAQIRAGQTTETAPAITKPIPAAQVVPQKFIKGSVCEKAVCDAGY